MADRTAAVLVPDMDAFTAEVERFRRRLRRRLVIVTVPAGAGLVG